MTAMTAMRLRAFFWFLLAGLLAMIGAAQFSGRLPLQTDLLALLPATERNPVAEKAVERLAGAIGNRAVFLVGTPFSEETGRAARRFASVLRESGAFRHVIAEIPPFDPLQLARFYHPYRFNLLDEAGRAAFEGGTPGLEERLRRKLHSPFRFGPSLPIADDPFGLSDAWLAGLPLKTLRLEPENGLLVARGHGGVWAFVSGELPGSAYDDEVQRRVADAVEKAETDLRAAVPEAEILRTGAVFYAEAARHGAEREFNFIGLGSLIGLLTLLYLVFRSPRPLVLGVLSVGFGILAAVVVTVSVYGELHLITLVFGASLTGEAIDYSIQYFAAHLGAGAAWEPMAGLRRIAPGLAVAFAASTLSYAALVVVPFPVFSQIALFALTGLGMACLTVFLLLPWLLARPGRRDPEAAVAFPRRFLAAWKARMGRRAALALYAAVFAVFLPGALRLQGNDDVRLLVERPPALQAQEERFRALAGLSNDSQFFLVEGADAEEMLHREERLTQALAELSAVGAVEGFSGISAFVPSRERQAQNRALWGQAVFADEPGLKHLLSETGLRDEVGERLIEDFKASGKSFLTLDDWLASPLSMPFRHLWLGQTGGGAACVVLLRGVRDLDRLAAVAEARPGITFVDKAGGVSRLFRAYRHGGALWLLGAMGLVYGVLALRYGFSTALAVFAPALAAITAALGVPGYLGLPFTLFNLTGLMLVLGVSVNYTVFLREGGRNAAATLAGVLLSAGTTLLSFGLLAFSAMPALSGFGLTLLIGIGVSGMLTPTVLSFSREAEQSGERRRRRL